MKVKEIWDKLDDALSFSHEEDGGDLGGLTLAWVL